MSRSSVVRQVVSQSSYYSILAGLIAIGVWGHMTHWRFSFTEPSSEYDDDAVSATAIDNQSSYNNIALDIAAGKKHSGIDVCLATTTKLNQTVRAMALLKYNGKRYSQISSKVDGHVVECFVTVGQRVRKGETLALIDSKAIGDAKADWLQKEVAYRFQKLKWDRLKSATAGVIPESRIVDAESSSREAELGAYMAKQRLMNLGFELEGQFDITDTLETLVEKIRLLGIPEDVLAKLPARPTTANLITLKSPFDGTVLDQQAVIGETVTTDDVEFIVADTEMLWVDLSVRREDAAIVEVGQTVQLVFDGIDQPLTTRLSWINSQVDSDTQTISAMCEIANKDTGGRLKANQFGTASIHVAHKEKAIVVPATAVQRMPDQREMVFVASEDRNQFQPQFVTIGLRLDDQVEIIEGLKAGELIAADGSFILKSEMMKSELEND